MTKDSITKNSVNSSRNFPIPSMQSPTDIVIVSQPVNGWKNGRPLQHVGPKEACISWIGSKPKFLDVPYATQMLLAQTSKKRKANNNFHDSSFQ